MADDVSALTPGEQAYFESGGQADPESGELASEEESSQSSKAESKSVEKSTAVDEPASTDTKQQKAAEKPAPTVPLAALHQARMEIKETKEKFAALEQKAQRMEQIYQQLAEERQRAAQAANAPQIPALDVDPVAHFAAKTQQLEQYIVQLHQTMQEQNTMSQQQWQQHQQAQQQAMQQQQFVQNVERSINEYKKTTPDFDVAADFLKAQIADDLTNQGVMDVQAGVNSQLMAIINSAQAAGMNPAHLAYQMAIGRGYTSQQQKATASSQANTDKIAQINKGQAAAKSLSSTGGKANGELTLEAMAEMDDDELAKHWGQLKKMM